MWMLAEQRRTKSTPGGAKLLEQFKAEIKRAKAGSIAAFIAVTLMTETRQRVLEALSP